MPLGTEVGLGPGDIVLDRDPAPQGTAPNFWPMSIVAKRSPISATAEHLLNVGAPVILGMGKARHFKFGVQIDIDEY